MEDRKYFLGGLGVLIKNLEAKDETNLTFPGWGGDGVQNKKLPRGSMDIPWHCTLLI